MRRVLYILGDLTDEDVEWIASAGEVKTFAKGDVLVTEGSPVEFLYILLKGQCSVNIATSSGSHEIAVLYPGEIIGELSFIDSRPPAASVVASDECRVLSVSCNNLQRKLNIDRAFAARFYRALGVFMADRLRSVMGHMGYGDVSSNSMNTDAVERDELDAEVLDSLELAAKRFDYILQRFNQ